MTRALVDLTAVVLPPEFAGLDLQVPAGACAALHAERAASEQLADVVGGLLTPSAGQVVVCGQEWRALSAAATYALRARVGRLGSHLAWIQNLNVDENVLLPLLDRTRAPLPELRARAHALAQALGLDEVPRARPARTARSELAVAAAVRMLLGDPDVLVIEPLDPALPESARRGLLGLVHAACARGAAAVWLSDTADHWFADLPPGPRGRLSGGSLALDDSPLANPEFDA